MKSRFVEVSRRTLGNGVVIKRVVDTRWARSRYKPHQGKRECARRQRHAA